MQSAYPDICKIMAGSKDVTECIAEKVDQYFVHIYIYRDIPGAVIRLITGTENKKHTFTCTVLIFKSFYIVATN